ncbi:hypothetical protein CF326_g7296, partial [Tilletia indica]
PHNLTLTPPNARERLNGSVEMSADNSPFRARPRSTPRETEAHGHSEVPDPIATTTRREHPSSARPASTSSMTTIFAHAVARTIKVWNSTTEDGDSPGKTSLSAIVSTVEETARPAARTGTTARPAAVTNAPPASICELPPSQAPNKSHPSVISAFSSFRRSLLQAGAFSDALGKLPASFQKRLAHVVPGIEHGFSMGALSMPSSTVLAPRHFTGEQAPLITAWKNKALVDGFALGPFSQQEIETCVGPFACVPLTVVHTPATDTKAEKNRVCFNASWPSNVESGSVGIQAINDEVQGEEWECEWLLITEVKLLLAYASPSACAMGFDLADAYQQLPNAPGQRRRFVFEVEGELFVWIVGMFGIATMAALFGQLCDILCWWVERSFPSTKARHFADDHLILHDGTSSCPSTQEVYTEVARFGWRVHATKHFPWSRRFVLLGFEWDMDSQTVALTDEKRSKYLRKLSAVLGAAGIRYKEIASVAGTLVHVCSIFPERRSYLNSIYAFRNRFNRQRRFQSLKIPTSTTSEIRSWITFLQTPSLVRSFRPPASSFPHLVYSDASNLGCGVVIDGQAQAWALPGMIDKEGIDIGVMEAWALQLALEACISMGATDCTVRFQVDNLGVVYAFRKGRSRSTWTNRCLRTIAELAVAANITMPMAIGRPLAGVPGGRLPLMRTSRFLRPVRSDAGTAPTASEASDNSLEADTTLPSQQSAPSPTQSFRPQRLRPPPSLLAFSTRPSAHAAPLSSASPLHAQRTSSTTTGLFRPLRGPASHSTLPIFPASPPLAGPPQQSILPSTGPSLRAIRPEALRPVAGMTPEAVWASLDASNTLTCDLSPAGARAICPRSHTTLLLTPALHLVQAVHGSSDLAHAHAQSRLLWHSVKENTRATYGREVIAYLAWCEDLGVAEHFRF